MPTMSDDVECTMLAEFLECSHIGETERLLEKLIHEQAAPIVERIVSFKVRGGPAEDVRGDVLADLIARLRELKESADSEIIRDFRSYAAVAAYNRCHEYYRRCFAQRHTSETSADHAQEIASVETKLMQRDGLRLLWREISRLPVAQRISLLLNMREEGGGAALTLLPLTGVATIGEIAAMLEMPEAELALMWNGLPVDDLRIAARLSLNRQQVISLRRLARERLKRGAGDRFLSPAVAPRADGPRKATARPTKRKP